MKFRVGHGYDVHALGEGLRLVLGGVDVPHTKGCIAHSDGDVLLHAICDALLGAAALGDMLTRMQDSTSGVIPTFWTSKENIEDLENFWINCHIFSAFRLYKLSLVAEEI